MIIPVPASTKNRALIVVDVQPKTLTVDSTQSTVDLIVRFIRATEYELYIVATYDAPTDSMLYKQSQWSLTSEEAGSTASEIIQEITTKKTKTLQVTKSVRSVLKCRQKELLQDTLKEHCIEEIHLVWFDINDCVLATAYDSIDSGYFTYVIEECCNCYNANKIVIDAATLVLREQNMTNHSTLFAVQNYEME